MLYIRRRRRPSPREEHFCGKRKYRRKVFLPEKISYVANDLYSYLGLLFTSIIHKNLKKKENKMERSLIKKIE